MKFDKLYGKILKEDYVTDITEKQCLLMQEYLKNLYVILYADVTQRIYLIVTEIEKRGDTWYFIGLNGEEEAITNLGSDSLIISSPKITNWEDIDKNKIPTAAIKVSRQESKIV